LLTSSTHTYSLHLYLFHFRVLRGTSHYLNHFLSFSGKCTSLYKTAFSARDEHAFVIFALGPPAFSTFQQCAPVCIK